MDNFFFDEARRNYEDFMRQYGDEMDKADKKNKEDDLRKKYGKNWKEYDKEARKGDAPPGRKRAYKLPIKKK
tara:strand:+ start:259 stop:474 length:216 start_codon:yes stop_codon:yes gene_type:complete